MKKSVKIPKWVTRIRKSKDRQHNGQKKKVQRTNNDLQKGGVYGFSYFH
jgi:hypothetical protein